SDNLWANLGANLRANLSDNLWANLSDNLSDNLWANLGANLRDNLRDNLWANLSDNLSDNLWANLGANLRANLSDNLWANLSDNLSDNLWANLGAKKLEFISTYLWGSGDVPWIAYYLFPHLHLRKMHTDAQMTILESWGTLARNCFWWYPFDGVCFVCDRPTAINMDAQWRLHSKDGPAVAFADGWNTYAVHGVRVPAWIIERPEAITPEKIESEQNAEVRRVMMDKFGWKAYCEQRGARMIDKHENDIFGELWEYTDKDGVKVQFIHVRNGTPEPDGTHKWYDMRVRPQFSIAIDAVYSTYPGISRDEFLAMSQFRS
ncbi:MAG: DUF6745 domain-containing protein, partial [Bellilinea sp.]